MTGTPAGVGPVQPGEVMHASVSGLGMLTAHIATPGRPSDSTRIEGHSPDPSRASRVE